MPRRLKNDTDQSSGGVLIRLFSDLGIVSGSFPMRIEDDIDLINSLRLQTRDRAAPQRQYRPLPRTGRKSGLTPMASSNGSKPSVMATHSVTHRKYCLSGVLSNCELPAYRP